MKSFTSLSALDWKQMFLKINSECSIEEQHPLSDYDYYAHQIQNIYENNGLSIKFDDALNISKSF